MSHYFTDEEMAYAVQKPSRAYNLTYILFGYTAASLFIKGYYEFSIQDMLALSVPIGSFIGAFLFYLKPELVLVDLLLRCLRTRSRPYDNLPVPRIEVPLRRLLASSYLASTMAYITGAFYFAISILLALFALSLPLNVVPLLRVATAVTFLRFCYEVYRLPGKVRAVHQFYTLIGMDERDLQSLNSSDLETQARNFQVLRENLNTIRNALERGDWLEVSELLIGIEGQIGMRTIRV